MDEEKKTYVFKYVVERVSRAEAEEILDILMEKGPLVFHLGKPSSHEKTFAQAEIIGMNEVEEDDDVETEAVESV